MVNIISKTADGKALVSGIYKLYETEGIPLDIIFTYCQASGYMVSWLHFMEEALQAGMKASRVISKLEEALSDAWPEYKSIIIRTLETIYIDLPDDSRDRIRKKYGFVKE